MKFKTYLPCDALRPFVRHLAVSESDSAVSYPVLPDTALVMGFQYCGRLAYIEKEQEHPLAAAGITGLLDGYRLFRNEPGTGTVLVVFREAGASAFIRQPLHELFGQSLSLEYFYSRQAIADTEQRLAGTPDEYEKVRVVEDFLLQHLTGQQRDPLVSAAMQQIHRSGGAVRIAELASILHTSQSPLEKRFRRFTGASPKKFAGIVRARNMITALEKGQLKDMEYLSSYYDQAHFIKDFKKFTAATPEQYLRSSRPNTRID